MCSNPPNGSHLAVTTELWQISFDCALCTLLLMEGQIPHAHTAHISNIWMMTDTCLFPGSRTSGPLGFVTFRHPPKT